MVNVRAVRRKTKPSLISEVGFVIALSEAKGRRQAAN